MDRSGVRWYVSTRGTSEAEPRHVSFITFVKFQTFMRNFIIITGFILQVLLLQGQDTLRVVQYNLLNYGNYTSYCTSSNNNINTKDEYLKKIIDYLQPDIFSVNEISQSESIQQHLLDQVLNTGGVTHYRKANFLHEAYSYLANMLYYNNDKLALQAHTIAQSYVRDVDVYKLYYKSDDLAQGDTAFIICVVGHLKAGRDDQTKRKIMAQNTMDYLNDFDDNNNYLMMGDFNLYSPTEGAYQQFLYYSNTNLRFNDPVDQYGEWHNNSYYSHYHTQSTHSTSNGCASSGGMDDRFDFILISNNIKNDTKNVHYVNNSYRAVGQDGQHFNKSVNDPPTNTSVPSDVLNALAYNSDHLPVTLKLAVDKTLGISEFNGVMEDITLVNPASSTLDLRLWAKEKSSLKIRMYNIMGELVMKDNVRINKGENRFTRSIENFKPGMYIVRMTDENSNTLTRKLLKY